MTTIRLIEPVQNELSTKDDIGFVPTMGALHEGHIALIRNARAACKTVVVSIFVNPTQFAPNEDFTRYPRQEEKDLEICEREGVDIVFAPSSEEMYQTQGSVVHVPLVSTTFEGIARPGHFDAVATVVLKLFNILRPKVSFFGLKDLQQCAVISKMVQDLNVPVEVRFVETVRDADGLALSSRNQYLTSEQRKIAPQLYQTLLDCIEGLRRKSPDAAHIDDIIQMGRRQLMKYGFAVDYLALIDPTNMQPVNRVTENSRLVVAADLGNVRLIDNAPIYFD